MAQLDKTHPQHKNQPARIAAEKIAPGKLPTGRIETVNTQTNNQRAVRILAKSLFRQLKDSGYHNRDVLALSAELVGLITTDLRPNAEAADGTTMSVSNAKRIAG